MRLYEIQWDGAKNLEELSTWGVWPMQELVNILDEEIDDGQNTDKRLLFVMYELRHKLEEMDKAVFKWIDERHKEEKSLAELSKLEDKGEVKDHVLSLPSIAISLIWT